MGTNKSNNILTAQVAVGLFQPGEEHRLCRSDDDPFRVGRLSVEI